LRFAALPSGLAVACVLGLACAAPPPSDPPRVRTAPLLASLRRGTGDGPVIVMLHGYGSRPEDLVSFAARTDLPEGTRFVFPYAPEATHPPDGPEGGYMWWRFIGVFSDARRLSFPGMPLARQRVIELLDALQEELGVESDRIVLGGFSQGAMLAMDVALHDPRPLAGVVFLSGTLVDAEEWTPHMASRRGLPVFQTHGREDDVLPFGPAEELATLLREHAVDVRFLPFRGRHEVTPQVSTDLAAFVREVTE
jgi:phospholipase/carboxylesterase